ncbi:MAG: ATP-binding protein [Rariglobus sp.]
MAALERRHFFIAACVAIFAAGVVGAVFSYHRAERLALEELTANARRCAVAFQNAGLGALEGTPADLEKPAYASVKKRLVELREVHPDVHFVYLFRPLPKQPGHVVFLADSEPAGSADISLPGDEFAEAPESPGLQSILASRQPATEGPLRDEFGVWMTAYAPIIDGSGHLDILGLDVAAKTWRAGLLEQAFRSALYIWLLFGLPLVVQLVVRRRSAQARTILKLSEAVEQSQSALVITSRTNRIEYANRGLCEQLGYTRNELIGRDWNEFYSLDEAGAAESLTAAMAAGISWEGEWTTRRKSGEHYPVSSVVTPVLDRRGRVLCFVTAWRDLTEAKRVETELRTAKNQAEAGERAKGEFLDTMSHELRTPLNGIVGFTSLLLDTSLTTEQREYVQTVRSSGEALLRLTGDILDYSRMESRPPPLETESCEVRALLEDVLNLLAAHAAAKGLVLLHQVGPDVPAVVTVDAGRLRQVLINLVGNAVKFTEKGEVEIRVRARADATEAEHGVRLDFSVRDTGPGINNEDQKRLFRPFTQLDASIHRRHGGTGLGLAISHSLVRLMGGEISLRSELGRGSVFRFSVKAVEVEPRVESMVLTGRRVGLVVRTPGLLRELFRVVAAAGGVPLACRLDDLGAAGVDLAVVDCDQGVMARVLEVAIDTTGWPVGAVIGLVTMAQGAEDRRHLRGIFHTLLSKPLHHDTLVATLAGSRSAEQADVRPLFDLRVLIVDDNAVNLRLLQGIVTALGCRSVAVSGGREALDALAADGRFDLVMLDLRMPDMDGLEVLRRVRSGEAGEGARGVWITIVTADTQSVTRGELFELGCNDFVTKPITLASCVAALQRRQHEGRA